MLYLCQNEVIELDTNNNKISFKNDFATAIILFIVTILFILFFAAIFKEKGTLGKEISLYYGFAFGCGLSALFTLCFIISGGLKNSFWVLIRRWTILFQNLNISIRYAIGDFFRNIFEEGIAFWCYLAVIFFQVYYCYIGFVKLIEIYM